MGALEIGFYLIETYTNLIQTLHFAKLYHNSTHYNLPELVGEWVMIIIISILKKDLFYQKMSPKRATEGYKDTLGELPRDWPWVRRLKGLADICAIQSPLSKAREILKLRPISVTLTLKDSLRRISGIRLYVPDHDSACKWGKVKSMDTQKTWNRTGGPAGQPSSVARPQTQSWITFHRPSSSLPPSWPQRNMLKHAPFSFTAMRNWFWGFCRSRWPSSPLGTL